MGSTRIFWPRWPNGHGNRPRLLDMANGTITSRSVLQCRTMTELGGMIREARLARRLNMAEAARLAGVSRGTWHALETGRRVGTITGTLDRMDDVLGLTPGTLRAVASGQPVPTTNVAVMRSRLAHYADSLSAEELARVLATIESPAATEATSDPRARALAELEAGYERARALLMEAT